MKEKRKEERKSITLSTVVRKFRPEGGQSIMEFCSRDLSIGGVFISTGDLFVFDLGEEIEIMVDAEGAKCYEGNARVVRSARIFTEEGTQAESGYGLMFLNPEKEFIDMLAHKLGA